MPKLTKAFLESLSRPERGQLIVRDEVLPGFGVRLTPNCISFVAEGRTGGKAKRLTVGKFPQLSVEDARSEAREILIDMAAGIERRAEPSVLTLRSALEQFLASRNIKPETKQCYRGLIERNLPDWLDLPLNEITKNMCEEKHKALIGPTRCGTQGKCRANRTFETLRTLMLWAADRYPALAMSNPVERLNKNGQWFKLQARQGTIPDDKLKQFYSAVMEQPKIASDYILLLLFSALRRKEAASLRWADIDFDKGTLTVPMSKSQRPHVLPLTKMLRAILESRKGNGSEYVFEGRYSGHLQEPRAPLENLRKQMGWHWLLHDLRRTCISAGEKVGVPFLALKAIAGHSVERSVTERYVVLDTEFVRGYLEAITERLLGLMGTSVEQWKQDDAGTARFNHSTSNQLKVKSIALIESAELPAYNLTAAIDWEDEVYF